MFTLRFDMRAPTWAAPIENLYAAAVEMAAWAESRGAILAVLSEHHGADDRHLPSPLILATAIAARTEQLPILVAAAVLPFYELVRLAEDIAVLDIISRGRVAYVLGVGHRREEYDHFGLDFRARGIRADERLARLIELVRGNEITPGEGSTRIRPQPTSGGPQLFIGGGSFAAARRAGRFGLGLIAQTATPGLTEAYEQACRQAGHEPGLVQLPDPAATTAIFVADDVDRAWEELGRYLLHDAMTAAAYRDGETSVASISTATSVEELRADSSYRVTTGEEATELVRAGTILPLLPLCGGLPPEVAWGYLESAAEAVVRGGGERIPGRQPT
jgi:alkanesulfonate monooxygenase SsuD/methylene tetrahydromethanopterin reductase-like flavin-dependent oxidoreductase (luciferase family)